MGGAGGDAQAAEPLTRAQRRRRLANGCEDLGNREMAANLRSCRRVYNVKKCENGHRITYPIKCGLQVCPECGSRKLAVDWWARLNLPDGLSLLELRSLSPFDLALEAASLLEQARNRFGKWRHARICNGVYGARLELTDSGLRPVILFVLLPGETLPDGGKAFAISNMIEGATSADALDWLDKHYQEEADCWRTADELSVILAESKKRRRFQTWGQEFSKGGVYVHTYEEPSPDNDGAAAETPEESEASMNRAQRRATGRKPPPSGGAGHGTGKRHEAACPICGGKVLPETVGIITLDEIEKDSNWKELPNGTYVWQGE